VLVFWLFLFLQITLKELIFIDINGHDLRILLFARKTSIQYHNFIVC